MDFLQFLNTLENTLEQISIRGRDDADRMTGIFMAIDNQRAMILASMKKGGDESGRQNDTGIADSDGNEQR